MLKNNNSLLLYKKIFNLKNKQNKLLLYITFYNMQKKFFAINSLKLEEYAAKLIILKKQNQIDNLFKIFLKINKHLKMKSSFINNDNQVSNLFINMFSQLKFEKKIGNKNIYNSLNIIILRYINSVYFFCLLQRYIFKSKNFNLIGIQYYNNFFKFIFNNIILNYSFIDFNIKNNISVTVNNLMDLKITKYLSFLKLLLLTKNNFYLYQSLDLIEYKNFYKIQFTSFYLNRYNYLKILVNFEYLYNLQKLFNSNFNILILLNLKTLNLISNFNYNIFYNYFGLSLLKQDNHINYTSIQHFTLINNFVLPYLLLNYTNNIEFNLENLSKHLTVGLLEKIQNKEISLRYNFQNFSIGEQNPQGMSTDDYLKFLGRKTTLSLMDRRGLIHRFFDKNVKNFYDNNFQISKYGYLINIDSIKLWITNFYNLLLKLYKGKLKGLELLILSGFDYHKKSKMRRLVITFLIIRQNMKNLVYNHSILSTNFSLFYFNKIEKNLVNHKNIILNKSIEDNNTLNQIFFLSVMCVKFITEKIIENELNNDSSMLEINRRNWYRNELYKLYRISIFNLSKEVFRSSFNKFIDFTYYRNSFGMGLSIITLEFQLLFNLVLPTLKHNNTSIINVNNTLNSIINEFRIAQKPYCNRFRFRYLRSYKHIFSENTYKRNLSLNMLLKTLKKNESLFFFNLIKQLNLSLISHIYLCQIVFYRILRLLQELRLLHLESFYFNKSNLESNLRRQIPEVYLYILNVLFFLIPDKQNKTIYKKFWFNSYKGYISGLKIYKKIGFKGHLLNLYRFNFPSIKDYKQNNWNRRIKQLASFCKNNIKKVPSKYGKRLNDLKQSSTTLIDTPKTINEGVDSLQLNQIKEIKKEILLDYNNSNLISSFLKLQSFNLNMNSTHKRIKPFSVLVLKLFLKYIGRYRYFLFMNETCNVILRSEKFYFNHLIYLNKTFFQNYMKLANISYAIFGKTKNENLKIINND